MSVSDSFSCVKFVIFKTIYGKSISYSIRAYPWASVQLPTCKISQLNFLLKIFWLMNLEYDKVNYEYFLNDFKTMKLRR